MTADQSHGDERSHDPQTTYTGAVRHTRPVFDVWCARCGWVECIGLLSRLTTFERLHGDHANG